LKEALPTLLGSFDREAWPQSLAGRFEQQVIHHGARIAVKSQSETVTYDRLNRAANRLARAILSHAEERDRPVALLFKQGVGLITANLAALKCGSPFVQVDYALPRERAARIIENAQPTVIVSDDEHAGFAGALARGDVQVINLDRLTGQPDANLEISVRPNQLAYINYTSGSTGEPKGVMSNHLSELHSIRVKAKALRIVPDDRISLLRSNNVGATSDALLGLLNGAALFPLEIKEAGLAGLGNWLINEEITVFTCVASVFRHAIGALAPEQRFSRIRLVHLGGEPLYRSDIELYRKHFADGCLLVNRLGISETKTASYFFIDKNSEIEEPVVPVGYPLEGYEISLLDDDGQAVGVGAVGEIAVKSEYLAQGYWRRPERTAAKFLADPVGSAARVYLSGDLGYRRADGCLVHVGRKDFQIKIRGHRVEISDVEIALLDIAEVRQAVVMARDNGDGKPRLTAYVVPKDGAVLTARRLRASLQEKLPSYMVPPFLVMLDRLPLTASGKIDRRALPAPGRGRVEPDPGFVLPESALEKVLAQLWCEVLELDEVGIADDFNELGGDSLVATQIVVRVNDLFTLEPPVKTLLETPTVAALAAFVTAQESFPGAAEETAVAILRIAAMSPAEIAVALADRRGLKIDG
jgi:amino acid adenylation domain-containing protein